MITDSNKRHYIAASNLPALLLGKSSNHQGDFNCLNCFSSYTTRNRLKEHEETCNKHGSCHIGMSRKVVRKNVKIQSGRKIIKSPICNLLKKNNLVKTIRTNCTQRKKISMSLLAGQCIQNIHLIKQKINSIITEDTVVWEGTFS